MKAHYQFIPLDREYLLYVRVFLLFRSTNVDEYSTNFTVIFFLCVITTHQLLGTLPSLNRVGRARIYS